jgi:hypothetical protein
MTSLTAQAEILCSASKNFDNITEQMVDATPQPGTPEYEDYDVEEEPQTLSLKVDQVEFEVTYLPYQDYFFINGKDVKSGVQASSYSDLTLVNDDGRFSVSCSIEEEE